MLTRLQASLLQFLPRIVLNNMKLSKVLTVFSMLGVLYGCAQQGGSFTVGIGATLMDLPKTFASAGVA